jgi:hypothetical protein
MQHFQAVYLIHQARRIREWEKEAEAGGGTFHSTPGLVDLGEGLHALARIRQVDGKEVFAVIVRQREDDTDDEKVVKAAKGLFPTPFVRVPKAYSPHPGWRDHLFYSTEIPEDVLARGQPA